MREKMEGGEGGDERRLIREYSTLSQKCPILITPLIVFRNDCCIACEFFV
jgi:hypothetical protein